MPRVGEKRPDGKVWAGDKFGWQSPQTIWKQQEPGSRKGEPRTLPGLGTKVWAGSDFGWQSQATIDKNKPGAKPVAEPAKPAKPKDSRLDSPIAGSGPEGNQVGSRPSLPPSPPAGGSGTGTGSRRPPAPAPARQPAPQASPVANYMKAAAAARKSGDPAEMAKVRDMGLEIWRKSNPKLAAASAERERVRGTAQSDNPLLDKMGLRSRMQVTPTVQSPTLSKDLGKSAGSFTRLTQNPNAGVSAAPKTTANIAPSAGSPTIKPSSLSGPTTSDINKLKMEKPTKTNIKASYEYDAYDLVLEYLISNGHVDTIEEANYVMMQMSSEYIQNIINE